MQVWRKWAASPDRSVAVRFERQRENEGRSLGRRLGPHASAMRLHDAPRDVEPEPRSLSIRSLGSLIAIENMREIFRSDPPSRVCDRDRERSVARPRAKCNGPTLRGE